MYVLYVVNLVFIILKKKKQEEKGEDDDDDADQLPTYVEMNPAELTLLLIIATTKKKQKKKSVGRVSIRSEKIYTLFFWRGVWWLNLIKQILKNQNKSQA